MTCRRCKVAESTGTFILLCDACFSWFESVVHADPSTKYELPDEQLEFIAHMAVRRPN